MKVSPNTLPGCALAPTRALVTRLATLVLASTSPQRLRISSDGINVSAAFLAEFAITSLTGSGSISRYFPRPESVAVASISAAFLAEFAITSLIGSGSVSRNFSRSESVAVASISLISRLDDESAAGALGATGTFMPTPPPTPGPLGASASTGIAIFARCKAARAASRPEPSGARPEPTEARPAPS